VTSQAPSEETGNCHNCGAAVDYHYCAVCGQETRLHVPSAGEFIHEFVGHYVALEGRLWTTLYSLLKRPGFLTAEYIAGRRKRYVEPLRVYLTFSIVFFALLKVIGPPLAPEGPPAAGATAQHAAEVRKESLSVIQLDSDSDAVRIGSLPKIGPKLKAFVERPANDQFKALAAGFFAYVPYAMFLLMPLFALYLKLLYLGSGRRYGEHLLFALHTNGFAFAMFSLMIIAGTLNLDAVVFVLALWLVIYLPLAMRRVFGGARWATLLRWIVLVTAHMLSMLAAIVAAFGLAILG